MHADDRLIEVLLYEDGTVGLIYELDTAPEPGGSAKRLSTGEALALTHSLLQLAGWLAEQVTGFTGRWLTGVLVDHLDGVTARESSAVVPYSRREYTNSATVGTEELLTHPELVADRLLAQLIRALGPVRA
jgi:hypothetical protein